jgi:hypothetical protein
VTAATRDAALELVHGAVWDRPELPAVEAVIGLKVDEVVGDLHENR